MKIKKSIQPSPPVRIMLMPDKLCDNGKPFKTAAIDIIAELGYSLRKSDNENNPFSQIIKDEGRKSLNKLLNEGTEKVVRFF